MGNEQAPRDQNQVPTLLAVDDVTGETRPVLVDEDGNVLIAASFDTIPVSGGGTGRTSFTAYAPIFGGTTSTGALQSGTVGNAGEVLTSNGAGVLPTFQAAGAGSANTALSNLASVAINAALVPGTAGALDFGSTTKPWASIWFAGTSGTPATNNFKITGASTSGTRTITAPDASGTMTLLGNSSTGSGNVVLATSPSLTTPNIGAATATSINGNTFTAGTYTLTGTAGKTLNFTNSLTLSGTDSTVMTFPSTSATLARTDAANTFTGASTASAWVLTSPTITTKISPTSDDGAPLGDTTHNFSDLFLATGAVLNYANGNVAITHTSGILTMGTGEFRITTPGTDSTSVPTLGSTSTLTNKRITRRSATTNAPGATPTTNSDNVDLQIFTGLATAITSMTTNLSGTPVAGNFLEFWLTDDGTARGITWGASFAATTVALPTTTVISTKLRVLFERGASTWDCVAVA